GHAAPHSRGRLRSQGRDRQGPRGTEAVPRGGDEAGEGRDLRQQQGRRPVRPRRGHARGRDPRSRRKGGGGGPGAAGGGRGGGQAAVQRTAGLGRAGTTRAGRLPAPRGSTCRGGGGVSRGSPPLAGQWLVAPWTVGKPRSPGQENRGRQGPSPLRCNLEACGREDHVVVFLSEVKADAQLVSGNELRVVTQQANGQSCARLSTHS